nr:M28 family peptidase [Pseudopedobacter sp.]
MRKIILSLVLTTFSTLTFAQYNTQQMLSVVQSFSKTSAVTGREQEAALFLKSLFADGTFKEDRLGNLVLTLGSGAPKRLFTVPLDEPGYVISNITDEGYLRITPIGYGQIGTMYAQFLQGNEIKINTDNGPVYGVDIVPSSHFEGLRAQPESTKPVHQWQDAFVDVGVNSPEGVKHKGIHLLDPLTAHKKPTIIAQKYLSAPAAKSKSAVIALATVAKTLMENKFKGTVVISFTTLELINGKGLDDVVNQYGPFDEVVRFNRFLDGNLKDKEEILVSQKLPFTNISQTITKATIPFRAYDKPAQVWKNAKVYEVGLASNYTHSPVEMVSASGIETLIKTWLNDVEVKDWKLAALPNPSIQEPINNYTTFKQEDALVANLVSKYGVSGSEKPVREFILSQLPSWAKPSVDAKGNIILTFGKGKQHIAFVAHMDEVGFVVDSIRNDGKIILKQLGGFFNSVWEGHAAIIHNGNIEIPAIFEPRTDYLTSKKRSDRKNSPIVFAGYNSKEEALAAGIKVGESTVTMPKEMIRLSENRATARGFDDRVGCASLLMALQNIDPEKLPFTVTFVWSVEEETGLTGSTFAAESLKYLQMVYPIDTYVSSDDPIDPRIYAYCPLGSGAVIRVLESVNIVRKKDLYYLQNLASKNSIKTQYGMTAGGTDGQGFLKYDIPSTPLSWPGRYSHSPIEVMDFRDMDNLVKLIKTLMMDSHKVY